jgi:chromosome segregation ATPase
MWFKIGQRWASLKKRSPKCHNEELLLRNCESSNVVPLRGADVVSPIIKKKDSAEVVSEAINKLVDRLEQINAGISLQTQQNIQLVDKISQLPDLLGGLPQQAQEQRQILQDLSAELKTKSANDRKMLESVAAMTEQTVEQTSKLGHIEEHLQVAERVNLQLSDTMGKLGQSLDKLDNETVSQTEWIQQMSRAFTATDRYLKYTLAQQQRRFMWTFAIAMVASLAAIAGLVIGIFVLSR